MNYAALVSHLDRLDSVPITIDSVVAWLRSQGLFDGVEIHQFSFSTDSIHGMYFAEREIPTPYSSEGRLTTYVCVSSSISKDMQRLVTCKELMHIFDPAEDRVATRDDLEALITGLVGNSLGVNRRVDRDQHAVLMALCALIPPTHRRELQALVESEGRPINEIADLVVLPVPWVRMWLSSAADLWFEQIVTDHSLKLALP